MLIVYPLWKVPMFLSGFQNQFKITEMHTKEHGHAYKQGENTGMYPRECHSLHLIFANTLRGKGNGGKGIKKVHFTSHSGILRRLF